MNKFNKLMNTVMRMVDINPVNMEYGKDLRNRNF